MKKITTLLFIVGSIASAQLLTDDFNFSGQLNATADWGIHSGTTNFITTTTGLTYTDYDGSGVGNAAQISNLSGEDVNRGFTEFNADGQSVYAFFLVNVNETAATKSGDYFLHLGNRTSSINFTTFCTRVFVKVTSDVVNFGISNTSTATYGTTSFAKNTSYLLVVKYTIATTGNDPVSLWVISAGVPADEATAGAAEIVNTGTTGSDIIDAVALRQGSSSASVGIIVDGLRISSSWESALPVELTSLNAFVKGNKVELHWSTATEVNNFGFEVERRVADVLHLAWVKVGFVEGSGTTNAPKEYSFFENNVSVGKYSYRLKQIDRDGKFSYSSEVEIMISQMPQIFALMQNYPNPFNPSTTISYSLPQQEFITIKVYDVLGREAAQLVNEVKNAGSFDVSFLAEHLSAGTYFYTLSAGNFFAVKKLTLIK